MPLLKRALLCCFLFLASHPSYAGDPQWVEVRSPNFSVITDAGEKRGRDVALHFEQMRSVFGTLMTRANVNLSVPLQIVAFRNSKEIRQVAPIFNGKPTELAGLFQGGEDRSFIMLDMSVENPWSVVFHEYAHRLMDGNLSFHTDPWFEEGFAEYFSSIEVDNKEARVGKIPNETYEILHQVGMMHVMDLFRVQQYTKTYNESGDHRTAFYATSGLVLHYLYDNLLIPKLALYFDTLQLKKKPVNEAIQTAFGMSPEQLDRVLRDYMNSGRFRYYPIPTPANIVPAQFTVAPVAVADSRAMLADIHAHSPDHKDQALAEFQDVLKMDPNNAAALRGVGYAYLQQRDLTHAGEYFQKAVERDSKDPRVHYYYALMLQQDPGDESKSERIEKELEAAIALDPKLADAYSLLGYTQAASGRPEIGMQTMKKAIELAPRNEHYQFNLANIYMMNRKMDDAIAIFRSLSGTGNPEISARANQALAQAETFQAQFKTYQVQMESRNSESIPETRAAPDSPVSRTEVSAKMAEPVAVRFMKGTLSAIDCSSGPQALFTVTAGARSVKLRVKDRAHMIVIGADEFSCDWKNKSVGVNFRERTDGDADVVSLEVQ